MAAARDASLVLIPCRPAIFDLRSIKTTIEITRLAQVPSMVLLNAVPARGKRTAEAHRAILCNQNNETTMIND